MNYAIIDMKTLLLIIFLTSGLLAQESDKPQRRGPPSQEQREHFRGENFKNGDFKRGDFKRGDFKKQSPRGENFRNRGGDCKECKEFRKHLQEKHPRNKPEGK